MYYFFIIILSTIPYSKASLLFIKKSLSVSLAIIFISLPVLIDKTSSVATDIFSPVIELLVMPARVVSGVLNYFYDFKNENTNVLGSVSFVPSVAKFS